MICLSCLVFPQQLLCECLISGFKQLKMRKIEKISLAFWRAVCYRWRHFPLFVNLGLAEGTIRTDWESIAMFMKQIRMARLAKWSDSEWFHLAFRRFGVFPQSSVRKKNRALEDWKCSRMRCFQLEKPTVFCCTHVQHRGNFCRVDSKSDPDVMSLSV